MSDSIEQWGIDNYVEHRLEEWAKWYRHNDYRHLGYPRESLESRHLNSGGVIHTYHGHKPLPCHPEAEELERMMGILRRVDEKVAKSLCQEYLSRDPQASKANAVGVSLAQFKINVAEARYWLYGWFQGLSKR